MPVKVTAPSVTATPMAAGSDIRGSDCSSRMTSFLISVSDFTGSPILRAGVASPFRLGQPPADCITRSANLRRHRGPTLDNEENYLIKKLFTALGAIQVENQARI